MAYLSIQWALVSLQVPMNNNNYMSTSFLKKDSTWMMILFVHWLLSCLSGGFHNIWELWLKNVTYGGGERGGSNCVTKALWTPFVWSETMKISVVDCDLTYLKVLMLPQLLASLPLGRAWKTSHWTKAPPLFTHESWMKIFKLSLSLKGLMEEMMPTNERGEPAVSYKWTSWVWK